MCLDEARIPGCSTDLVDKLVGNNSTDWKEQSVVAFREKLQVFATTEVAACGVHVPGLNLAIAWGEYILIKVQSHLRGSPQGFLWRCGKWSSRRVGSGGRRTSRLSTSPSGRPGRDSEVTRCLGI